NPDWFNDFVEALAAFQASLPLGLKSQWENGERGFKLTIDAPTEHHRSLSLHGDQYELEYALGAVWTEGLTPSPDVCRRLLASLDAVRSGSVREVEDVRTGIIYHAYRLRTRGLHEVMWDSQYSIWTWLKLRVRRIRIHTLPPLESTRMSA